MNLHALRLFYQAASLGSVTLAAEALHLSQPAVTAQIKKLEREIGLRLLIPQGRGVMLTEAGSHLAAEARRLFELEGHIEETLEQLKAGSAGKLHLAATYLPANFLLPKWIARYKRAYPGVGVELSTSNSSQAADLLLHYRAEIAFIGGIRLDHPLLLRTPWYEDEMCFIVHKGHPLAGARVTLEEMLQEPFIYREEGSFGREQLIALCSARHLPAPPVGLQMNGLNETLRVVMEGYGAAFLSLLETREHIAAGVISRVEIDGVHMTNPVSIYTRKEEASPPAQRFIDMILAKS
ncbi:LysR family transcriptional regulator [Paenibacillus cineris]|uniref:Transcriptional regulator n=1 Tax=Paenibacillus cineris TaxID=237530 RepID=A0ABQ4LLD3_9BACL|nr:LysR family transcriptional regulator [Paenibacillus cineris]GIO57324.1 transcriptional regulator [Paenibacillus cineris]